MIWTEEEMDFVRQYYPEKGRQWVARKLGKTTNSIKAITFRLGLKRKRAWDNLVLSDVQKKLIAWSIAWEGSIGLHRDKQKKNSQNFYLKPRIGVYNTDYNLLTKFKELVGLGHIHRHKASLPSGKNMWIWSCTGIRKCRYLLQNILPELPSKRKQAELLLEFCNMPKKIPNMNYVPRAFEIQQTMLKLNGKGLKMMEVIV